MSSRASSATYGSTSGVPSIVTFPAGSQQAMVSPPTAMTRFRKTPSLQHGSAPGGAGNREKSTCQTKLERYRAALIGGVDPQRYHRRRAIRMLRGFDVTDQRQSGRRTVQRPDWAPDDVNMLTPSPARMYDALLGGSHNFEVDRNAAAQAVTMVPDLANVAISNRAFLRRAVRYLLGAGIRQFLDIGAGIPTVGNTHEVAQAVDPQARVAYVDIDSVAVAQATAILAGNSHAIAVQGDLRNPDRLLTDPRLTAFIDFDAPVGVLLVAVLHLLTDADKPTGVVAALRDAITPGSHIVISHLTRAHRPDDAARLGAHAATRSGVPIIFRSRAEITAFFEGLTLVDPGVVALPGWRPETPDDVEQDPGKSLALAGVGRKD
jgi:hypothetical protein